MSENPDGHDPILPYDKALIIIPTYNELENVENMIRAIFNESSHFSILVIDDGSPDGTAEVVKKMQHEFSQLHLLERSQKLGLGSAYVTGFRYAIKNHYDFIFEIDCDFSHDPKDLHALLEKALHYDLVIGSRYVGGIRIMNWSFSQLLLSYGASIYTRLITGIPILDPTGGFKCFTRKALLAIDLKKVFSNGYSFQLELNFKIWSKGLSIHEYPIIFTERRVGQSKMGLDIVLEAIVAVWRLRILKILGKLD